MLAFYITYGCYVFVLDLFFGKLPVAAYQPPFALHTFVPIKWMQLWRFVASHAIDLINIFHVWKYCERQSIFLWYSSHLVTLVASPPPPHHRPLFHSSCIDRGGKVTSRALQHWERWGAHSVWQLRITPSVQNMLLLSFNLKYRIFCIFPHHWEKEKSWPGGYKW